MYRNGTGTLHDLFSQEVKALSFYLLLNFYQHHI